jgi:signal transduction histidine kinase
MSLWRATWDNGRLTTVLIHDLSARKELDNAIMQTTTQVQMDIGHELHDNAGQELTGLGYMAQTLENMLADGSDGSAAEHRLARKIREGLQRTLTQVRNLAHGLVPVEMDAGGLMSALQQMAQRRSEIYGIQVTFRCDDPVELRDNEKANQLFLIAREAVLNAVKHGKAQQIEIGLWRDDEWVNLTVHDNGIGIPPNVDPNAGSGLRIMRHRAGLIGGHLTIQGSRDEGTLVSCLVRPSSI